ncbi:hypothetical protein SDC9_139540 [bioreactor metagenome]|uniref:Uncharacterized protein n=1 Tax=bioreactor metagenome TaxID=1076179 RepID=A0A645DT02_9ZZZZ
MQVQRDAFLVAVEEREETRPRAQQLARGIAVAAMSHGLDLDDLGAQIGQHQPAARAHHHVDEFDDADAGVGQVAWSGRWLFLCHAQISVVVVVRLESFGQPGQWGHAV